MSQLDDVDQRNVLLAAFDDSNVVAMEISQRQLELQRLDLWLQQCERERPSTWWGIVVSGVLIVLILAQLLEMSLRIVAQQVNG